MTRPIGERALVAVLLARFVRARWGYRFRSRARLDAWQRRRIRGFLARDLPKAPFYATQTSSTRRRPRRLEALPIVDKGVLLEHFDALNTRGVRLADALAVALEAEHTRDFRPVVADDVTVGLSSGTSGRRGAFLVSPRERMLWAGTVLGRLLDGRMVARLVQPWKPPLRIAFFLRAGGNLYESVASSRVRFSFFDLTEPLETHRLELARAIAAGHGPDILVAPASVLRALALADSALSGTASSGTGSRGTASSGTASLSPGLVVSVAEVLEPDLAGLVRRAWNAPLRQVYQATEGLLALTCAAGALHLNEESVHIEREWLDAGRTRFTPVVTDFDRRTQIIARYRLDDVLRIDRDAPERCACGRVSAVIAAVDGRHDAVLRLPHRDGLRTVDVFPDAVRRSFMLRSDSYADWRVRQRGLDVHVSLADPAPGGAERAVAALEKLFERYECRATVVVDEWVEPEPGAKVRRVVREETGR